MNSDNLNHDNTAAIAEAFVIANLLFVGVFYLALWVLYLHRSNRCSDVGKNHLNQSLLVSSLTTFIFIVINVYIVLTTGYASLNALFTLEVYYMLVVPIFLVLAIIGFTKAIKGNIYIYPVIGRLRKISNQPV